MTTLRHQWYREWEEGGKDKSRDHIVAPGSVGGLSHGVMRRDQILNRTQWSIFPLTFSSWVVITIFT